MKAAKVILERDHFRIRRVGWSDVGSVNVDYADVVALEALSQNGRPAGLVLSLRNGDELRIDLGRFEEVRRLRDEFEEIIAPRVIREERPLDFGLYAGICRELVESRGMNIRKAADFLLSQGLAHQASDIMLEPAEAGLEVRFKIDGMLFKAADFDPEVGRRLLNSLKVAAGMVLYRRDIIQEGRISRETRDGFQDLRISVMPSDRGERMAVRTFDRLKGTSHLDELGYSPDILAALLEVSSSPRGLFLIGGPSGSGKTTTSYAMLRHIQAERGRLAGVISLEDPIEYRLGGVTQVQVSPGSAMDFASVLKSSLRQDPGVIMVGEIRDHETAAAVIQAALTGHLVLSTVHCGRAAEAVVRLLDLGLAPFLVQSALAGVLSQRLVRKLCQSCGGAGSDCAFCRGTGYCGRTVIAEFLRVTPEIGQLIRLNAETRAVEKAALDHGMTTLRENGMNLVQARVTNSKEIERVLG